MKQNIPFLYFLLLFFSGNAILAQHFEKDIHLNWKGIVTEQLTPDHTARYISFTDAEIDPNTLLPAYADYFSIEKAGSQLEVTITNQVFVPCVAEEEDYLRGKDFHSREVVITTQILTGRNMAAVVRATIVPLRYNDSTAHYEKLTAFTLSVTATPTGVSTAKKVLKFAEHSVLKSGIWHKIRVAENGIYKIGYSDLVGFGIDPATVNPANLSIYGNGGGMLPERNSTARHDDLQENPIYIHGAEDGSFNEDDYVLFFGMGPHTWNEQLNFILQELNLYEDYSYYYLTTSFEAGNRILTEDPPVGAVSNTTSKFNDFQVVEDELHNLIESGKVWYGDEFGEITTRDYHFHFPHIVPETPVSIKTSVANRTYINDLMVINVNNDFSDSVTLTSIDVNSTKFGQKKKKTVYLNDLDPDIHVKIDYFPAEPGSRMWLNFINVNAISAIKPINGQLQFRDLSTIAEGAITQFVVDHPDPNTRVWDVTDPVHPFEMETSFVNNQTVFLAATDSLREFIAFDGSSYKSPEYMGLVENQDLHGSGPFEMVIVTHPDFMDQAQQLAGFHESFDGFKVLVVTPDVIYNEFSSGKQDPTAIRDMLRYYYLIHAGNEPRYLLLFGDGSFDPKERLEHNTNLVPTFQTAESLITATSYVVDDYFGLLDDDEGDDATGYLDIGIGRLPVKTPEEAQAMVDKILRYTVPEEPQFGKWRTQVCMIADDEDGNLHFEQADSLASGTGFVSPRYNQRKIYLDAFPQIKTPSGHRYPDVTEEINKQVDEGALIINYIGHGGTGGWAHERILQQNDMINWKNALKLPMFVTATCEFSRFDEPEIVSGGEMVMLNPEGGGIALFTTTRLAYSQSNFRLNQRLYARAFTPVDGEMPYLGDLIRESKPPGQLTTRNFVLLGDPALRLSYPKHNVKTVSINGKPAGDMIALQDTIRSLQTITITGEIEDLSGNPVEDFEGFVYPVLYDKRTKYKTIGNDPNSFPANFYNQDKIVWEGKAVVSGGKFSFTLVVPLDIALNYGEAKISYYAFSDTEDASGYYNNVILGGIDPNAPADNTGPVIDLFINDTTFISGQLTHENPTLLAYIGDENGINRSQNGIGHAITLVMDADYSNVMQVDSYFELKAGDYRNGYLEYPFFDLPNGTHTLTLKAWDSYNNSSSSSIEFVIDRNSELNLYEVMNYPNPFAEKTTFTFSHTRPGDELNVELTIFDLTGRFILTYATSVQSASTAVPFLTWDGRDVNGAKLPQGMYVYTLRVTDGLGQESIIRQKMMLGY